MTLDGVVTRDVHGRREARRLGLRAGAGVALAFIVGALAYAAVLDRNPSGTIPGVLLLAVPTLAAGVLGGRFFGPAAGRATGKMEWLGIVFGLAAAAIVIGAAATGLEFLVGALVADNPQLGLLQRIGSGLVYLGTATIAGPFILGPAAFPFTATAATLWAIVVRRRRARGAIA